MDKQTNKAILTTGIRPTGELHLGNYYGAMNNLIPLQHAYDAYFFIADLHSLTTHPKPEAMQRTVLDVAKNYLAAGLDPAACALYAQSSLAPEICELHTYLSMVMPLGDLLRVPTFKEKVKKHPDNVNYGLVGYPVLMAADILIHKGRVVPVGDDQVVHLELGRTIVRRFNALYGDMFPEPQPVKENAVRIPSLNGQGKMSKSDAADSCISLSDTSDAIAGKVRKAYSDPERVYRQQPGHPTREACNVFHLHSYFTDTDELKQIETDCKNATIGCVDCKAKLAKSLQAVVEPFRLRRSKIHDLDALEALKMGQVKAKVSAQRTISEVRKRIGLHMI